MKRSNIEFAKRVFLDRLTAEAPYIYGGVCDSGNFGIGGDCSGLVGILTAIALRGPQYFTSGYARQYSTETFPGGFSEFNRVDRADLLYGDYPVKVCIHHGGGGPYSHMNCQIDGWLMESNSNGICTGANATPLDSDYWNDWWVAKGPIEDDTDWRCIPYARGFDYAGGRIKGSDIKNAGGSFVCRYLYDGGTNLPYKRLSPEEASDLTASGVAIVSNWESWANRMRDGYAAGFNDATSALEWHLKCGGPRDCVIYFSCDYDAPEADQPAINEYLRGCGDVLGGPEHVGIYAAYYAGRRALDAGRVNWLWQTEAWSAGIGHATNVDYRVNLVQRNKLGYQMIAGVPTDINEVHTDNFGQWGCEQPAPEPEPEPEPGTPNLPGELTEREVVNQVWEQLRGMGGRGWVQLGQNASGADLTLVDGVAAMKQDVEYIKLKVEELCQEKS